jgi:hypothetical protein
VVISPRSVGVAVLLLAVGAALGGVAMYSARAYDATYQPGFARLEGYSVSADGRTLVVGSAVGAGDILLGPEVDERPDSVTVTVRASIYVPGRNMFKNLSATLDTTRIALTEPLGARQIIDGASGKVQKRIP